MAQNHPVVVKFSSYYSAVQYSVLLLTDLCMRQKKSDIQAAAVATTAEENGKRCVGLPFTSLVLGKQLLASLGQENTLFYSSVLNSSE